MNILNLETSESVATLILYLDLLNVVAPIAGISLSLYALFSKMYRTRSRPIAASVHLFIVVWVLLLWADTGDIYNPVLATVASRYIVLAINILVLISVLQRRRYRRVKVSNRKAD